MKRVVLLLMLGLLAMSIANGATYSENFDTAGYWAGGSMTSYNAKTYANTSAPESDVFSSNSAIREGTNTHSGAYAWRLNQGAYYFRYACTVTISSFSVWIARWDNDPAPSFIIRYSTNSGTTYTDINTLDGNWFDTDLGYKQYSHTFTTPISPSTGQVLYIEVNKTTGERLLLDDFVIEYGAPPTSPTSLAATDPGPNEFTANWNAVDGATGYYLDLYTKTSGGNATDLFISEYIEGSSNNKAIEIFNGTGSAVNLSAYSLRKQTNGAGVFGGELVLSNVSLADGDVYIVANSAANSTILSLADQTTGGTPMDFNGNDAVALYHSGTQIDVVGIVDQVSPDWGANVTLVRKPSIYSPTTSYSISDWDSYASDTTAYLGSHSFTGGMSIVPVYSNIDVGNVTSYEVTGLDPATTYYYVVRAYNEYGTSTNSNEIEVTTDEPLPVVLSSFTASISAQNYVTLTWVTQTETGMLGYYVYRANDGQLATAELVSPMVGATNTSVAQTYVYSDSEIYNSATYYYWLESVDFDGNNQFFGPVSIVYDVTGEYYNPEVPLVTELRSVYPNPFNPVAYIPFSLGASSEVSIKIYNNRGQIVRDFQIGEKLPGEYRLEWNGRDDSGQALASGVYYIRMSAGKDSFQRKAVLLK